MVYYNNYVWNCSWFVTFVRKTWVRFRNFLTLLHVCEQLQVIVSIHSIWKICSNMFLWYVYIQFCFYSDFMRLYKRNLYPWRKSVITHKVCIIRVRRVNWNWIVKGLTISWGCVVIMGECVTLHVANAAMYNWIYCCGVIDIAIRTDSSYALHENQTNNTNSQFILVKIFLKSLGNELMRIRIKFSINSDG
jgi:hypothetical protein